MSKDNDNETQTPLEQFAYDLHQEVLVKCADDTDPELREDAFTEVVLDLLTEHNEADGAEVCYWNAKSHGRTPAAKVNAWALSGDGATLDLFVVLYQGEGDPKPVARTDMESHYKQARGFFRRALDKFHEQVEEANVVFEAMRRIHEAREFMTTVRLFFLTDGVVKSADIEQEQIAGYELRYVFWDIKKLSRLRVGEREAIELNFVKDYGGAVSALETKSALDEYRTFLAYLPGPMVARIYGEHGQRLLERNVRAFLQAKGKVNKGLQQTLREESVSPTVRHRDSHHPFEHANSSGQGRKPGAATARPRCKAQSRKRGPFTPRRHRDEVPPKACEVSVYQALEATKGTAEGDDGREKSGR